MEWVNGIKEGTEGWDDRNTNNDDGCNGCSSSKI